MKIGIVLPSTPAYSETFIISKIEGLLNSGYEVELFVNKKASIFNMCEQHQLPAGFISTLFTTIYTLLLHPYRSLKFITAEIREGKSWYNILTGFYSSLHLLNSNNLEQVHFGFMTMAVGRENVAKAIDAKMSTSIRGFDISRYPLNHPNAYKNIWPKIDKLHYLSEALLKKAYSSGLEKNSRTKCVKITPAIDADFFTAVKHKDEFTKPIQLLTIARLHWSKGLEYTIEAMEYLKNKGIDFHYTIVGDGSDYERLVSTSHLLNLNDKITFAGKVEHKKLINYYKNCDVYIQYSVQEGFCNAVLEAQAMQLPCIVSDAEGLPENVLNNITGWVIPACDPEILAEKIIEVISLPAESVQLVCKSARNRVIENFNLKEQRKQFNEFFQN